MKKIAVFTSGGDSPGMNACIRAVVRTAIYNNLKIVGIKKGFAGMLESEFIPMSSRSVANIIQHGGTILKTSRSEEFRTVEGRKKVAENLKKEGVEALVCIGGEGSYTGADLLYKEHGIPSIGAPGTIDNDLFGTDHTIGFDTAINTALEAIDRIRDTAESHNRTFFIEVMGRHTGFIALEVGISGGAEAIFLPETKNCDNWIDAVFAPGKRKKSFSIIVVAEGDEGGGALSMMEKVKAKYPEIDSRVSILGHIQRGGKPSAMDRMLATRLGVGAVEGLIKGEKNKAVGLINNKITYTDYESAINKRKDLNEELLRLMSILNV